MKKITCKMAACFMIAMLLCMPVLTGCDLFDNSSKGLEFTSNGDGTCYVSGIGECTDTEVVIPKKSPDRERVTSIIADAFYGCTSLTSITIPDSVTRIGGHAFDGCIGLTSITIPDSVTRIEGGAFFDCTSLTSVTIPNSVRSIELQVFANCTGLTSITIPTGAKSIGLEAFYNCTGLTSITIPDSVTSIFRGAFVGCTALTDVYYSGTISQWKSVDIWYSNDPLLSATIHCTDGDITPEQ